MRIVLMSRLKQALRCASRAMFNAGLMVMAIDVNLPHRAPVETFETARKIETTSRSWGMLPRRHARPAKFDRVG
jgi:hypothetical protein